MTVQDFDPAERFVAGTVGPAGQRAFYLQARDGARLLTVAVEKQQVSILADRINDVLDELAPAAAVEPGQPGGAPEDTDPLETPFDEDWRVQTLSLAWDEGHQRIVIECHDHDPDEEDPDESEAAPLGRNTLRVALDPAQARAFARRTARIVAAGRPPCPFCGGPLDPSGHVCPRANGYKR
ncbi:hypothetical protein N865_07875 [Intrasporangium oryzae NRRL B-24470]|uniref:Repeat protein (TIGR03847 family) n=1 Tax=Intrasporangium oryzae NRRL B-24470 TaxID=1386089 RepID=W9G6W2_9MICO|nr:DUF3090 domain-containing protein [Intrasporangium oryzae]EWT01770.1 hypothetical protein N865_07875 [Intrasporangium oryzae NRRL B-24470]